MIRARFCMMCGTAIGDSAPSAPVKKCGSTAKTAVVNYSPETDFKWVENDDGTVNITQYTGDSVKVNIPPTINGKSVTIIGGYAFLDCTSLQSINIPDSVTSIGNDAFHGCISLQSISIPDSVTSIDNWAFVCCNSLQSINIPDSVTSIGKYAFEGCTSLQSINIPDSVTSIEERAFKDCTSLERINIPDSVTSIGKEAFDGCPSLKINYKGRQYYPKEIYDVIKNQ